MADDLFDNLLAAQTPEDEMRLVLSALPLALANAGWASAIPHWFTPEVLAALLPDQASQTADLYVQLRQLAFVESYLDRGYSVHELSRNTILNLWWNTRRDEYRRLSEQVEAYFNVQGNDEARVEAAYHSLVAPALDQSRIASRWSEIASRLKVSGRFSLAYTLIQNAREHIASGRVSESIVKLS